MWMNARRAAVALIGLAASAVPAGAQDPSVSGTVTLAGRRGPDGAEPRTFRVRLTDLLNGGDISQDVPMRPGDTLIIPQSWF